MDELYKNKITFVVLDATRIYTPTGIMKERLPKESYEYFSTLFKYPKDREIHRTSNEFKEGTIVRKGNENDIVYVRYDGKYMELKKVKK